MKNKYTKRRYKLYSGVQKIQMDTPDYSKAYELQAEEGAKNQGIKNAASQFSGAYAPIGQIGGMAGDVIKSRNKSKGGAQLGGAVSMGSSGAALGMKLGGPWGAAAGLVAGGIYGAVKGGQEYEEGKKRQEEEDTRVGLVNANKSIKEGSYTDAQSFLAKKGKYKVKSKQPRMIETEGREPIFSPKKADGTRDLLYYNPNDPTHEEGGVKAMVIPKAQKGKQKVKAKAKPVEEPYTPLEDDDSIIEEVGEILDPTGISSYDDVYRSTRNLINKKDKTIGDYAGVGLDVLGAVPVIGKAGKLIKMGKTAFKYLDKGADAGKIIKRVKQIQKVSQAKKPTGNILTRYAKKGTRVGDKISDFNTVFDLGKDGPNEVLNTNYSAKDPNILNKDYSVYKNPDWDRTHTLENATLLGRKIFPKMSNEKMYEYGSKKIMSQRKPYKNPEITPPTPYELMPKPPKSRYEKGGKYVKVYQDGTEDLAAYKHTKTFKSKPAYQTALQAHDDSLNLYGQSRYFTDVVKRSGLYNPTIEHPEVKPITRTGKGKAPSPLKAYGAPNDASEDIITVAGNNPVRKDLYSRKESQYKSFKEHEAAKASGKNYGTHEGYEINMYKHPEMALEYEPDSVKSLQGKKIKLQTSRDTIPNRTPIKPVIVPKVPDVKVPTKPIVTDTTTTATPKTPARNKFLGKEKTGLQKFGEKAGNLLGKIGTSKRMSNGKSVKVFK